MAEKRRKATLAEKAGGAAVVGGLGTALYVGLRHAQNAENQANRAARARIDRARAAKGKPPLKAPAQSRTARVAKAVGRGTLTTAKAVGKGAVAVTRMATTDITGIKGVAGVATKAGRAEAVAGGKQAVQTLRSTVGAVRDARAAGAGVVQAAKVAASGGSTAVGQAAKLLSAFGGAGKVAALGLTVGASAWAAHAAYRKGKAANDAAGGIATNAIDQLTGGGTSTFRDRVAAGDSYATAAARGFATFIDKKLLFGAGQAAKDKLQRTFSPDAPETKARQAEASKPIGLSAALAAARGTQHAGTHVPLPPNEKVQDASNRSGGSRGTQTAEKGKGEKATMVTYQTVDGRSVQLSQGRAEAAQARRKDGERTPGGALKAA